VTRLQTGQGNQTTAYQPRCSSGDGTVAVTATDGSEIGNKQLSVDSSGSTKTFTYDANGNLLSDDRHFEWTREISSLV
jgi:YD repeat-containing protein